MPPPAVPPAKVRSIAAKRNGHTKEPSECTGQNLPKIIEPSIVIALMHKAQHNEASHEKYFKELQSVYDKVGSHIHTLICSSILIQPIPPSRLATMRS